MQKLLFKIIYLLVIINNAFSLESIALINNTGFRISLYYTYETVSGNILKKETDLIKNRGHKILYEQKYSSTNKQLFNARDIYVPYRPKALKSPLRILAISIYTANKTVVKKYTNTISNISNLIIEMLGQTNKINDLIIDMVNTNNLEVNPQFVNQTNGSNYTYSLSFDPYTSKFSIAEKESYHR
ncbi:MAG: hypothetical protein HRT87_02145 [Legionellales bacterium]|nr:hypothetical protein [Legionellales bacterium]